MKRSSALLLATLSACSATPPPDGGAADAARGTSDLGAPPLDLGSSPQPGSDLSIVASNDDLANPLQDDLAIPLHDDLALPVDLAVPPLDLAPTADDLATLPPRDLALPGPDLAGYCLAMQPAMELHQNYCQNGEGPMFCFYESPPLVAL
jgi:hypothetical protein